MSHWTHILTAAEIEIKLARIAALDPAYAASKRNWYETRTAAQLEALMYQAWLTNEGETYQLARSYLELKNKPQENAPMTYLQAKALKEKLEKSAAEASAALRAVPGIGSGPMGLTPDHVKNSRRYRVTLATYETAHETLRQFNAVYTRLFAREIRAERRARDAARTAARFAA